MIKATEFHYEFLKQVNRVNSDYNKSISVAARDSYFNHAKEVVLENLYAAAEVNTSVRNHLRTLEKKKEKLEKIRSEKDFTVYRFPNDYYRLLRQWALVSTKDCTENRIINIRTVQSDDLNETLKDPYWKPSFEWEETVGDEGSEGYYVYKDETYEIEELFVDYLKKPGDICAPSLLDSGKCYKNSKGESVCTDKDFDIDSTYLWRKIVDVSVLFALRDLGQVDDMQGKMNEILFTDRLNVT